MHCGTSLLIPANDDLMSQGGLLAGIIVEDEGLGLSPCGTRHRDDLIVSGEAYKLAEALYEKARRLFGRSLKLRQVSAGGCNACEADLNVLCTAVFDLSRFGIQFVASPRHADGLVVTGPVTANTKQALLKTYTAVPAPKLVMAVGACAISGGPYAGHDECLGGAEACIRVDLFVPGCPPHPITMLKVFCGCSGGWAILGFSTRQACPSIRRPCSTSRCWPRT
jgi:Ni,Fe-hydrogenase III small subunit